VELPLKTFGRTCKKHPQLRGERYLPNYRCTACHKSDARAKAGRERDSHLKKQRDRARVRHQERKALIIRHYGGKCELCSEANPVVLTVDHKGGGGSAHRQKLAGGKKRLMLHVGSVAVYRDIINRGFPPEFRLLCFNCNIKEHARVTLRIS